ncbi:hypothetical protein DPMN_166280 [Dreissena polymorpha]|uniref:Uncharacterized protein n=1 Tax=Dreissena polymorpha TaxID=45954 RepID=A0A9D4IXR3_DREPO|nr:hypothetical protein DPMN_166280 [Dreissena polymorpha]
MDLAGLNFILNHVISRSKSLSIHLSSGTDLAVIAISCIKALVGGWRIPQMSKHKTVRSPLVA